MINLETERLKLVPFIKSDVELLHTLFTDPFIRKYLWDDEIIELKKTQSLLADNEKHFKTNKWGMWKILLRDTLETFGFVGLWPFYDEPQPQLIYGLLPAYIGQGYASEASRMITKYAFENLHFNYLIASMDEPNIFSRKVVNRLGMKLIGKRKVNDKSILFFEIKNCQP